MTTTLPASSPPSTLPNPNSNPTMASQSPSHSDQPAVSSISADTSSPSYSAAADSPTSFTDSPSRLSTSFNDPPPFDFSDDTASSTSSSLLHSTPEPPELTTTLLPSLLHLSFNQDFGCFAAGTDRGFRIYNCDPFREIFRRDFDSGGGIGVVQMLFANDCGINAKRSCKHAIVFILIFPFLHSQVSVVGDFSEEDVESCIIDYLGTVRARRGAVRALSYSPINFRPSYHDLYSQLALLKDTDERACAYIAGPAPNRWGFNVEGEDLFQSLNNVSHDDITPSVW